MVGLTGVVKRSSGGTGGAGWRAAMSAGGARRWTISSSSKLERIAPESRVAAGLSECEPQLREAYGARVRARAKPRTSLNGRREQREARTDDVEIWAVSQGGGSTYRGAERYYEWASKWDGGRPVVSGRRDITVTSREGALVLPSKRLLAENRL